MGLTQREEEELYNEWVEEQEQYSNEDTRVLNDQYEEMETKRWFK